MTTINQTGYGKLEIDTSEKDIVQIWMIEKSESNVIQVQRENILKLIEILKNEIR